jgi:hypothetical protein
MIIVQRQLENHLFSWIVEIKNNILLNICSYLLKNYIYLKSINRELFQLHRNCEQSVEYQQHCANHSFRIVGLEDLETISLIDVYKRPIHAAIQ